MDEPERNPGFNPNFRVQLIGGPVSGGTVEISSLRPSIRVYQSGAAPFALPPEAAPPGDVSLLGEYDIVEPLGPDVPTYVVRSR